MKINITNGKIFGHPVHLMLVHFPASLFPLSFIADLAGMLFEYPPLFLMAFYLAAAGTVFGGLAAVFGLIDLLQLHQGSKQQSVAIIHGSLGVLCLIIFGVVVLFQFKELPGISNPGIIIIACKGIVTLGLMFSNYLGGELVLKYRIGMKDGKDLKD